MNEIELARAAAANRNLDDTFRHPQRDADVSVRWVYVHMIEEYARHNGHADLLRERIDGATSVFVEVDVEPPATGPELHHALSALSVATRMAFAMARWRAGTAGLRSYLYLLRLRPGSSRRGLSRSGKRYSSQDRFRR